VLGTFLPLMSSQRIDRLWQEPTFAKQVKIGINGQSRADCRPIGSERTLQGCR
jgi:hypothetical protein